MRRKARPTPKRAAKRLRRSTRARNAWAARRAGGVEILQTAALQKLPWLVHGFSTRTGGASHVSGHSKSGRVLNLGFTEWDTRECVLANRRKFLGALGAAGMKLVALRQFHSDLIRVFDRAPEQSLRGLPRAAPRGDAAITRTPGLLLAVQTADCVPILLVDQRKCVVATVHAGWRGTLKRIATKTLGRMRAEFGTNPADVTAVLGPGIGRCCYEVGPEVAQAFAGQFERANEWFDGPFERLATGEEPNPLKWLTMIPPGHEPPPPRVQLDLIAANRWQLADAGVPAAQIVASNLCTSCRTDLLFSYRKEKGRTGRLMGVIGIRPR
jgi:YfiH family protein